MNWYPRYPGDYMRDTSHLTLVENGAYTKMLDLYYAAGAPHPADVVVLRRMVGAMTPEEQAAVSKIADEFFPVNGDGKRHNRRADKELLKAEEKTEKARQSATQRWESERNANAMRTHMPSQCSPQPPPQPPPQSRTQNPEARTPIKDTFIGRGKGDVVLPFESHEFKEAWSAWKDHRKKIRAPMTARAQKLILDKLPKDELKAIEWINNAIEKGWRGIYEPNMLAGRSRRATLTEVFAARGSNDEQ